MESISPEKLRTDIHEALRLWHKPNDNESPLHYLYLFQQAQQAPTHSARFATNEILLQALKVMETQHDAQGADLLRLRFLEEIPMYQVANHLNMAEATAHRKQRQAIEQLADVLGRLEQQARDEVTLRLEKRLNLPVPATLFGVQAARENVLKALLSPGPAWLIVIEGLGGIGKTALANLIIREMALAGRFQAITWISAQQQEFLPGLGSRPTGQVTVDREVLVDMLLKQMGDEASRGLSPQQKFAALTRSLKERPCLVVVDNLESAVDTEAIWPTLAQLANPSKFLLTSRVVQPHPDMARIHLSELSQSDTLALLRHEASVRQMKSLAEATPAQLKRIYEVVGGNPLALKLVVGQLHSLSLSQVLEGLKLAQGRKIEELYNYIYWQAWQNLRETSRQLLLAMPLAQNGGVEQLAVTSQLGVAELQEALEALIACSLIEVGGDLEQRRYRIHRLTETFLLHEVLKW